MGSGGGACYRLQSIESEEELREAVKGEGHGLEAMLLQRVHERPNRRRHRLLHQPLIRKAERGKGV